MAARSVRFLVLILLPLAMAGSSPAQTWFVPDDYPTIQAALDAVPAGDTIVVRDGTWLGDGNRNLDFGGKDLVLRSENGPGACILNAEGNASVNQRVFHFHGGETRDAIVEGFTITGGHVYWAYQLGEAGGGIFCENGSSPTVRNCIIEGNQAKHGGGIRLGTGSAYIYQCIIRDNHADQTTGFGGGIAMSSSNGTVSECEIRGNTAANGAGIGASYGTPLVFNCLVIGNVASLRGGGMSSGTSGVQMRFSTLSANQAPMGGGVFVSGGLEFEKCTISGNRAVEDGPDTGLGGGIMFFGVMNVSVTYTIIARNTCDALDGGPQLALQTDTGTPNVTVDHSLVVGGVADAYDPDGGLNWGTYSLDEDPQFCSSEPDLEEWWALQDDSPCWTHGWGVIGAWSAECGPSPIYLQDFTARQADSGVHLSWSVHAAAEAEDFRLVGRRDGSTWTVTFAPTTSRMFEGWDQSTAARTAGQIDYELSYLDATGGSTHLAHRSVTIVPSAGVARIVAAHPNPFNPRVTVDFAVPRTMRVFLAVFDLEGRRVALLGEHTYLPGNHTVVWDGRDAAGHELAAGTYLLHLETDTVRESRKVVLVK